MRSAAVLDIVDQEYEWCTDYLKGRTQVVGFQGARSDAESICVGVPQGSILGRLLCVLHVNDLPTVARKCSMLMTLSYSILDRSLLHSRKVSMKILTEAMLFGPHARLSDVDFGITFKGRPRPRYNITKNGLNMFPEIPDFFSEYLEMFFEISRKYLASFHKYYSKNTHKN